MRISVTGLIVGSLIGCVARSAVVLLNVGSEAGMLMLPSAGIGLLVGAIAGAAGRPLLGAAIGAVLSGVVFEFFMCACASLVGRISEKAGSDFLFETLRYAVEMALAGGVAGAIGGLCGQSELKGSGQDNGKTKA